MTHLIHVGNSLGIRIPKAILTQMRFTENTNLVFKVTKEGLLISPAQQNREGWAEAFQAAQESQTEPLLMGNKIINKFDQEEWEW